MNIIETLKSVDFEKQYISIVFENRETIRIGDSIRDNSYPNHFKKAEFQSVEDGLITFKYGDNIYCFKPSAISHFEIYNIFYNDLSETKTEED